MNVRCSVVQDPDAPLTPEQIDHFLVNGYVALPGLFPEDFNDAMKRVHCSSARRPIDKRATADAVPGRGRRCEGKKTPQRPL